MTCPYTVTETIRVLLPKLTFDAVPPAVRSDVLRMAFKIKRRDRLMVDELICSCIRASADDDGLFYDLLQFPRAAWIESMLSAHGVQRFEMICLNDFTLCEPISALDWEKTDRREILELLALLKPTFDKPKNFLLPACRYAMQQESHDLLLEIFAVAKITQRTLLAHLDDLARHFDALPALHPICAQAFDQGRHTQGWDPVDLVRLALMNDLPHLMATVLAAERRIPRCPIQDFVIPFSMSWTKSLPRIAASAHAQFGLVSALRKIGGTQEIFATPSAELRALFLRHDPSPEDPKDDPVLALFPKVSA